MNMMKFLPPRLRAPVLAGLARYREHPDGREQQAGH
jgi:hypothetical protein